MQTKDDDIEVWRDVIGREGEYQVSNLGRVRSLDRTIVYKNGRLVHRKGKVLSQGNSGGYKFVNLGDGNSKKVHVLVAEAFIGIRPDGLDVCHNDGDKTNNRLSNLRYGTRSENNLDGYEIRGYVTKNQKLSPSEVREIKDKLLQGYSRRQLAKEYDVCKSTITAIKEGDLYGWL